MTGFGAARRSGKGFRLDVEVRSVNHRFLQVKVRGSRELSFLEAPLEELARSRVGRGSLTVRVALERTAPPAKLLDRAFLEAYAREFQRLEKALEIPAGLNLASLADLPGVLLEAPGPDPEDVGRQARKALIEALDQMEEMRRREGSVLVQDMEKRAARMETLLEKVAAKAPVSLERARRKLAGKVKDLLEEAAAGEISEEKVFMETAFLLERMDFTEETVRLGSHLKQWRRILSGGGEVGKRLEFLLQEMVREINTLGSKAGDATISHLVVGLKDEVEKLKEQVQNLE